jgi:hypothetical protein
MISAPYKRELLPLATTAFRRIRRWLENSQDEWFLRLRFLRSRCQRRTRPRLAAALGDLAFLDASAMDDGERFRRTC